MPPARTDARIEDIEFKYSKPLVSVDTGTNDVEHETIDDEIVVQILGRIADRITVEGLVTSNQVAKIDNLVKTGLVEVRTERWAGDAVCTSTSTSFHGGYDTDDDWLYNYTIDLIEVDETEILSGGSGGFGGFDVEQYFPSPDTTAPSITNFNVSASGGDVTVSFRSSESANTIDCSMTDGTNVISLSASDFSESRVGDEFEYSATESVSPSGEWTVTLLSVTDARGNDGLEGGGDPSRSVTV